MFSKELKIMMLEARVDKLAQKFENGKLIAKAQRKLRKLKNS